MQFTKIHHLAIIGADYASTKAFYVDKLGLKIIREVYRPERQSYKLNLKLGDSQLEIFSFPHAPARVNRPEACGLRHLALAVADMTATINELNARGIAVEPVRVDEFTHKKFTFFHDPDGLPIELYEDVEATK